MLTNVLVQNIYKAMHHSAAFVYRFLSLRNSLISFAKEILNKTCLLTCLHKKNKHHNFESRVSLLLVDGNWRDLPFLRRRVRSEGGRENLYSNGVWTNGASITIWHVQQQPSITTKSGFVQTNNSFWQAVGNRAVIPARFYSNASIFSS